MNISTCFIKADSGICLVKLCSKCVEGDGFTCSQCLSKDYEVGASGECVKKSEKIPAVTWKDLFRMNMNSQKTLNNGKL